MSIITVSEHDLLRTRGKGVFTTCLVVGKKVFHFNEHMTRLITACEEANIDCSPVELIKTISEKVSDVLQQCEDPWSKMRITISGGDSEDDITQYGNPAVTVTVRPISSLPSSAVLKLKTMYGGRRYPQIKAVGSYFDVILDLGAVRKQGFDDLLYVDDSFEHKDMIKETSLGNIFFVTNGGELWTPAQRVLKGITRDIVLKLAQESGLFRIVDEVSKITTNSFPGFVEAFRTSTTMGIVPIERMDDKTLVVGADTYTTKLQTLFTHYVQNYFANYRA